MVIYIAIAIITFIGGIIIGSTYYGQDNSKNNDNTAKTNNSPVEEDPKSLVTGLQDSVIWTGEEFENVLKLAGSGEVESITVGRRPQIGTQSYFTIRIIPDGYVRLDAPLSSKLDIALDQYGELKDGYWFQVGTYDFNKDGKLEYIVAAGDGFSELGVEVLKYAAPQDLNDLDESNIKLIGEFKGQAKAFLNKGEIFLPVGSAGLGDWYVWYDGVFLQQ